MLLEDRNAVIYDGRVMGDTMSGKPLASNPWDSIEIPTLVLDDGASEGWVQSGVRQLAEILPDNRSITPEDQNRGPADDVLVPALAEFFAG